MPRVLVPLAEGLEELEAVTIIDLLRRGEVEVVTAALGAREVTASHGTVLVADTTLDAVADESFDMVVLPGGLPGADHLDQDPRVRALLERHHAAGAYTAAICAAPKALASLGLLDERRATHYPGALNAADFPRAELVDAPVVIDGTVVTGRGPGTAMDFALELLELLQGSERRTQVETGLARAG
ncbi:DJ-1 family glyoxalase III [Marichromatium bheemlicum]|uniref:DJ-1/PfpI family protein n=1 Tax=Marichromatium bheemlicum TaxID=365339 RepID=A0ABX1I7D2_9GAMM|nr:DJ-1 family glyoxalase III [Marichromatium bheemlicum]NKN32651.1 DJ-1/PfpI family protein [Marichromatium bheemlicum]